MKTFEQPKRSKVVPINLSLALCANHSQSIEGTQLNTIISPKSG